MPRDVHALTLDNYVNAVSQSRDAGATITLTSPTWREMEPSPGVYDFEGPLGGSLYQLTQGMGMGHYFGIQLINTSVKELPADLAGRSWTDPVVLARFEKLVAALKNQKISVNAISVGNEVDVYFASHPQELAPYLQFLRAAKPVIKRYFPNVRVGTTVTFEGLKTGRQAAISQLVDATDIVFFTYYPVIDLVPLPLKDVPAHVNAMVSAAKGRQVVVQEFSFPASRAVGSSESLQATFFRVVLPLLMTNPKVEASFIYALHDLSPTYCDMQLSYYGAGGYSVAVQDRFKEYLCTLGLRRNDGGARMSYEVVRQKLTQ